MIDSAYVCFPLNDYGNGVLGIGPCTRLDALPPGGVDIDIRLDMITDTMACVVERGCIKPPAADFMAKLYGHGDAITLLLGVI